MNEEGCCPGYFGHRALLHGLSSSVSACLRCLRNAKLPGITKWSEWSGILESLIYHVSDGGIKISLLITTYLGRQFKINMIVLIYDGRRCRDYFNHWIMQAESLFNIWSLLRIATNERAQVISSRMIYAMLLGQNIRNKDNISIASAA